MFLADAVWTVHNLNLNMMTLISHACLGEDEEDSDKEEDEELDKKMGDLGDGQTDTLDERMWGDDEDDDDYVDSDKEEESGPGMDQGESELVAKDDNMDAGESKKDKSQDKDHPQDEEEKEKIHEQVDEVSPSPFFL